MNNIYRTKNIQLIILYALYADLLSVNVSFGIHTAQLKWSLGRRLEDRLFLSRQIQLFIIIVPYTIKLFSFILRPGSIVSLPREPFAGPSHTNTDSIRCD